MVNTQTGPKHCLKFCLLNIFAIAALIASPAVWSLASHHVYLTASEQEGIPQSDAHTEFSCNDKIFAVIDVAGLSHEKHKLNAVWRDPRGKDREHTEYEFNVYNQHERIWVWLKLHRSTEAALVSFLNPSAGMEEFIGEWELHLSIDNKPMDTKSFSVIC